MTNFTQRPDRSRIADLALAPPNLPEDWPAARIIETLRARFPDVAARHGVTYLGLFGSYIHNRQRSDSDVDVLVDFGRPIGLFELIALERALSEAIGARVDLVPRRGLKPRIGRRILAEVIPVREAPGDDSGREWQPTGARRLHGDYLQNMLDAINDAENITAGQTLADFAGDQLTMDAVTCALRMLGEAPHASRPNSENATLRFTGATLRT